MIRQGIFSVDTQMQPKIEERYRHAVDRKRWYERALMSRIPTHSLSLGAQGNEPKGHSKTPKWTEFAPVRRGAARRHTYRPGGDEKGTACPKLMNSTRGGASGFLTRGSWGCTAAHSSSAIGMACLAHLQAIPAVYRLSNRKDGVAKCLAHTQFLLLIVDAVKV